MRQKILKIMSATGRNVKARKGPSEVKGLSAIYVEVLEGPSPHRNHRVEPSVKNRRTDKGASSFRRLDLPWEVAAPRPGLRSTISSVSSISKKHHESGLKHNRPLPFTHSTTRPCSTVSPASFLGPLRCLSSQRLAQHCLPGSPTLNHNYTGCLGPTSAGQRPLLR